jgi:hypothetical protein
LSVVEEPGPPLDRYSVFPFDVLSSKAVAELGSFVIPSYRLSFNPQTNIFVVIVVSSSLLYGLLSALASSITSISTNASVWFSPQEIYLILISPI